MTPPMPFEKFLQECNVKIPGSLWLKVSKVDLDKKQVIVTYDMFSWTGYDRDLMCPLCSQEIDVHHIIDIEEELCLNTELAPIEYTPEDLFLCLKAHYDEVHCEQAQEDHPLRCSKCGTDLHVGDKIDPTSIHVICKSCSQSQKGGI